MQRWRQTWEQGGPRALWGRRVRRRCRG
nr:hypothetical protein [Streptomyces sp. CB02613]